MDIGAAVGGGAAYFVKKKVDDYFANKAEQRQYDRSVVMYGRRYQMQMRDMRRAGLNPMLAASSGAGSVTSFPVSNTVTSDSPVSSAKQFTEMEVNIQNVKKAEQDVKESIAREQKALYETVESETRSNLNRQTEMATYYKAMKDIEDIKLIMAEVQNTFADTLYKGQSTRQLEAELRMVNEKLKEMENRGDISDSMIGKVLTWTQRITEAVGLHSGANFSFSGGGSKSTRRFR